MDKPLKILIAKIDGMNKRERIYLLVTLLLVTVMGWKLVVNDPMSSQLTKTRVEIDKVSREIKNLTLRKNGIINNPFEDPNLPLKKKLAADEKELKTIEAQLKQAENNLSSPEEMAKTLEEMLSQMAGLTLVSMRTLESNRLELDQIQRQIEKTLTGESALPEQGAKLSQSETVNLFRQGLVLNFTGNYLDTLKFLNELEALPLTFFWNDIDFSTGDQLPSQVQISLNTLSFIDGFIGVPLKLERRLTSVSGQEFALTDPTLAAEMPVDIQVEANNLEEQKRLSGIHLTSILISPTRQVAIANSRVVRVGESLNGLLITAIDPDAIHVAWNGKQHKIAMRQNPFGLSKFAMTEDGR
ncbi:MAG: hypothetical protein HQL72_06810 [Magnetococcales bacterium]|nr:hypothetical protein [Magnetococcales bacterium]